MCIHPCFHKTPGCLWCNLCSGKEEEEHIEEDLQEFQDFDEFEDQASDLPQSAAYGGLIYVGYISILCTLIYIMQMTLVFNVITYSLLLFEALCYDESFM